AEERLRIARELHDVFGHTMATISVQAGVGLHVLEQRPGQSREALTAIKAICDDGLTDVKTILGLLRDVPAPAARAVAAPRPGPRRRAEQLRGPLTGARHRRDARTRPRALRQAHRGPA